MIRIVIVFSLVLETFAVHSASAQGLPDKPNIVVYISDDHNADDIGAYGATDVKTPVLDQLAADGMRFTQAFAAAPVCAPSRGALYTGLYPHKNGLHPNHADSKQGILSVAHHLAEEGYDVVLAGKTHIGPKSVYPFTYIQRWEIPAYLEKAGAKPFAMFIAYNMPHGPIVPLKGGYREGEVNLKPYLPDVEISYTYQAAYYDLITVLDHEVGAHQYWLSRYGFLDDAVQIFLTDQGWSFPLGKYSLYDEGIRGGFIVKWPGIVEPGGVSDALISYVDVVPTMIDIAGGTPPSGLDGKSILPVLTGQDGDVHDAVFATHTNEGVHDAKPYPIRAVRTDRYKLIVNLAAPEPFYIGALYSRDERPGYRTVEIMNAWRKMAETDEEAARSLARVTDRPLVELYDIKADRYEMNNLAQDPQYKDMKADLLTALHGWMVEQGDVELPAFEEKLR